MRATIQYVKTTDPLCGLPYKVVTPAVRLNSRAAILRYCILNMKSPQVVETVRFMNAISDDPYLEEGTHFCEASRDKGGLFGDKGEVIYGHRVTIYDKPDIE